MKKTFFYSLFTICMLALAAGFTACSSDDEDINFYSFGILKYSQSGSFDEIAAMSAAVSYTHLTLPTICSV